MAKCNPRQFPAQVGNGKTTLSCPKQQILFSQGDAADAVFSIQTGKIRLSVASSQGQEAIAAILGQGAFFGKGCLAGQPLLDFNGHRWAGPIERPR
jgi:CRP/FNR family cyclic AMP-dependent transcriptional regulator